MAQKKKKKKQRPKYFRILLSLALFFYAMYLLASFVYGFFTDKATTYVADVGTLRVEDKAEALVIRNEMLIKTQLKGKLTYFYNEGDKVKKGQTIVEIYNDGKTPIATDDSEREQIKKQTEFDYNVLGYDIEKIKKSIELALDSNQYDEIPALKKQLMQSIERMDKLKTDNRFLVNRSETFTEQTVGTGVLTEGQRKAIQTPADGILSYSSDGLEGIMQLDNIYNINIAKSLSELPASTLLKTEYVSGNPSIFRIVDHATYYLAGLVPIDSIESYKKGQDMDVDFGGKKVKGEILDAYAEEKNGVVLVRLKEPFDKFQSERAVSVSFVKEDFKGLKVPTDAIMNEDGVLSVFIVESTGKLKKMPVKIIGYDAEYAVVYNEQFYDLQKGIVRSLKLGQTVVRNAHMYKEGQMLE